MYRDNTDTYKIVQVIVVLTEKFGCHNYELFHFKYI